VSETASRRLHIGGKQVSADWEIFNANPVAGVDHLGDARDLSRFPDATFAEIYASHVIEHFDYKKELAEALREWCRVLVPGGRLYIGAPDMDILARLFIEKDKLTRDERYFVMRMMFGGHIDNYDYHLVGLNEEFLRQFLLQTGFANIFRVESFGHFQDTSDMRFKGVPISVNLVAEKPRAQSAPVA
jgi:predicted SAM-dependent methyltransferase